METTLSIRITADGADQIQIVGADLVWPTDGSPLTGFTQVRFLISATSWLRFDVDPTAANGIDGNGSYIVLEVSETVPDAPNVRVIKDEGAKPTLSRIQFNWPCPLTPDSAGLWFRLLLKPIGSDLVVYSDATVPVNPQSKLAYNLGSVWHEVTFTDTRLKLTGSGMDGVTAQYWSECWKDVAMFPVYAQPGSLDSISFGCHLLENTGSNWLVNVSEIKAVYPPASFFRVGFMPSTLPDDGTTEYHLVSRLNLSFASTAVELNEAPLCVITGTGRIFPGISELTLSCVRAFGLKDTPGRAWLIDWSDVPGKAGPQMFSLAMLYPWIARHYPMGLAAARSKGRLTYVPTSLIAQNPVTLRFLLTDNQFELQQILLGSGNPLSFQFGGATDQGGNLQTLDFIAYNVRIYSLEDAIQKFDESAEHTLLSLSLTKGNGHIDQIISGVAVTAAPLSIVTSNDFLTGQFTLSFQPGKDLYGQSPIGVSVSFHFTTATLVPRSEDPEVGYETLSGWLGRERPMVVPISNNLLGLRLDILEIASQDQSRLLQVTATAQDASSSLNIDAVVIDPSPLTIARVQTSVPALGGQVVAVYLDDSEQPPGWTFLNSGGIMTLVLPPQVIGEEMVKGRIWVGQVKNNSLTYVEEPERGKLFDFRLGLPTSLTLDSTDIDTARTDAPWALRRLMGQRVGVMGVKLNRAVFELLYGLTTTISATGLRVAELDAFVGRIPFSDDLLFALRQSLYMPDSTRLQSTAPTSTAAYNISNLQKTYSEQIGNWILDLFYRPSWWPIFGTAANRQVLTVADGVTFAFRPSRQSADPFDASKFAVDHLLPSRAGSVGAFGKLPAIKQISDTDRKRLPLRGGVDWPFQSVNIYEEVLGSKSTADSSVSGVAFGSLGGSGSQNAVFANGKTIIISDTTQGRLNSLTVIRVGRIGKLWNHARHVIRYERTSRRAPRYGFGGVLQPGVDDLDSQSDSFEGFGALRKVREYIEIKEPRRTYPDSPADPVICGPLLQSTFETIIIPVKASWGQDVVSGWVMPLRGPFVSKDEEKYYPFPKIFLELARAVEKGGGTVPHPVADPSQLAFFTSTRLQDGGNTDIWPAWPDIDFPLITQPAPPDLPFSSCFAGTKKQPDAASVEFGQKSFTIDLGPTGEAVNLMQGRSSPSMDAQVKNITLARGTLPAGSVQGPVATQVAPKFGAGAAQMYDGLAELTSHLAALYQTAPTATLDSLGTLRSDIQGILNRLQDAATNAQNAINTAVPDTFQWQTEQGRWDDNAIKRLSNAPSDLISLLGWTPLSQVDDAMLTQLRHGWDALQQQGQQALLQIGYLPDQALSRIRAARDNLAARLQSEASSSLNELISVLTTGKQRYAETTATTNGLITELTEAYQAEVSRMQTLCQDAEHWVENMLGPWFSRLSSVNTDNSHAFGLLTIPVQTWLQAMADYLNAALVPPPPPVPPPPQITQLKFDDLIGYLNNKLAKLAIDDVFTSVDNIINDQLMPALGNWDADIKALSTGFTNVCKELHAVLYGDATHTLPPTSGAIQTAIAGISQQIATWTDTNSPIRLKGKVDSLLNSSKWQTIPGVFNQAQTILANANQAISSIQSAINKSGAAISDVAGAVETSAKLWSRQLQAAGAQIEQSVRNDISSIVGKLPDIVANTDLNLTRVLAGGPVTDTIACTRDALGYYYDSAKDLLDVTRSNAIFNDLGPAVLNSLSASIPFDRIRDRLLPQIGSLDVNKLFPDFGGLKLSDFLPDLQVPVDGTEQYGWLIVKHGFDQSRLTAWADVSINKQFDDTVLFSLPPFELQVLKPQFVASSRMEMSTDGKSIQTTKAALSGNWTLNLSGEALVTMIGASLKYDSSGGFNFDFQSKNIQMAGALQFITEAVQNLLPDLGDGLTLTPIAPGGISVELSLPLPDIGTGAFTLTGITLYTHFDLIIATGFELRTGFWLSKPDRPFGLAILFLGGGGWFGIEVNYRPTDTFTTQVSIGISAGAFLAIDLGVVSGSAGILFTAGLDFFHSSGNGGGGNTDISLGLLVWGEMSVLGIASASLRITYRITYDTAGGMQGYGEIKLSIKICWCFTLEVDASTTIQFSKPGGGGSRVTNATSRSSLSNASPMPAFATASAGPATQNGHNNPPSPPPYGALSTPEYLDTAVDLQFMNLDLN
jgi:hypothetical protein